MNEIQTFSSWYLACRNFVTHKKKKIKQDCVDAGVMTQQHLHNKWLSEKSTLGLDGVLHNKPY